MNDVEAREQFEKIGTRLGKLERDALYLKAYTSAAFLVAAIFGLAGAWGYNSISTLKSELSEAERKLKEMTEQVDETIALLNTDAMRRRLEELAPQVLSISIQSRLDTKLDERISPLNQTIASLNNSVVAFESVRCPEGWREYAPARDRFLRGIDTTSAQPRVPGSPQPDALQAHTHVLTPVTGKAHGSDNQHPHGYASGQYGIAVRTTGEVSSSARVADETRPKNVAVLFCTRG